MKEEEEKWSLTEAVMQKIKKVRKKAAVIIV